MKKKTTAVILSAITIMSALTACSSSNIAVSNQSETERNGSFTDGEIVSSSPEVSSENTSLEEKAELINGMPSLEKTVDSGGDEYADFISATEFSFGCLSFEYFDLGDCTKEKAVAWIDEYEKKKNDLSIFNDIDTYPNLYSFMKKFNVSYDELMEKYEEHLAFAEREGFHPIEFTEAELEALKSMDKVKITSAFKNDSSIQVGDKCYTGRWIYYATKEDYKQAGITAEQLENVKKNSRFFTKDLPEKARTAFVQKIASIS